MPFAKRKQGSKWVIVNKDTGDIKGTHDTEKEANAQLAVLAIHVPEAFKHINVRGVTIT